MRAKFKHRNNVDIFSTYSVVANDCAKIWRLQTMDYLYKLGAVICIDLRKQTPREYTQLQKHCYSFILCFAFYFNLNKLPSNIFNPKLIFSKNYFVGTKTPFPFRIGPSHAAHDPFAYFLPLSTFPT